MKRVITLKRHKGVHVENPTYEWLKWNGGDDTHYGEPEYSRSTPYDIVVVTIDGKERFEIEAKLCMKFYGILPKPDHQVYTELDINEWGLEGEGYK